MVRVRIKYPRRRERHAYSGLHQQDLSRNTRAYFRGCLSKRQHVSKVEAKQTIREVFGRDKQGVRPYRCRFCASWHIGHNAILRDRALTDYLYGLALPVSRYALQAWRDLTSCYKNVPIPNAGVGPDDDMIMFTWDNAVHHLELEVWQDGHGEWFYLNRTTDAMGEAEYNIGSTLPILHIS